MGNHARSAARLQPAPRRGKCLHCHTTGLAPTGTVVAYRVECEACHGAGAGYATVDIMLNPFLSRQLGLRDLSTDEEISALCSSCHTSDQRLVPLDLLTLWKQQKHQL